MKKIWNTRKFKYGSVATAISVVFVVIVIALNFLASALVERFPLKVDVTAEGFYSISNQTAGFLSDLDTDVTITVLASEDEFAGTNDYLQRTNELFHRYAQMNSHITLRYVDLLEDPNFLRDYETENLSAGEILVEANGKLKKLGLMDLFNIDSSSGTISSRAENALTSAIMIVTSDEELNVAMIIGHQETESAELITLLAENAYNVDYVNLALEDISPETTVVVIAAPLVDYTTDELKKLDAYLDNDGMFGKTLLYFASGQQGDLLALEAFLDEWGIAVDPGVVVETNANRILLNAYFSLVDYANNEFNIEFAENRLYLLPVRSKPMYAAFETESNRTVTVLAQFPETAYILPPDADTSTWEPTEDSVHGPFAAAIQGTRARMVNNTERQSHVVAFSSVDMLTYITDSRFANGEYILDLVNDLTENEVSVTIFSKDMTMKTMSISNQMKVVYSIVFIGVIPLVLVVCGLVVWVRRRNK